MYRLPESTPTIAIYYYYSAWKLILIYRPTEGRRLSRLSWLVTYRDGLPVHRRSPILVLTGSDVIYLVWPHQSCWSTCAAIGLVGHQSSKKPIRDCFSRCRPFLKLFTVLAFTVWWSKLFHLLTNRSVKKCVSLPIYSCVYSASIHDLWGALWWKIQT